MFLHACIPNFHAAVHQAAEPAWRGRPLAVAIDAGDQAPLIAVSAEAAARSIQVGTRSAAARRACPGLIVVAPEPDWYRRAQQAVIELLATANPRVGGEAGALDVDLAGTERFWALGSGDHLFQAERLAQRLRQSALHDLGLDLRIGVASQRLVARLAAARALSTDVGIVTAGPENTRALVDAARISDCPACSSTLGDDLAREGILTIGALRARGIPALIEQHGDDAGPLLNLLLGEDDAALPELADPQPSLGETQRCLHGEAEDVLPVLATALAERLETMHLASCSLRVVAHRANGTTCTRSIDLERQIHRSDDIDHVARDLVARLPRRARWERLSLFADDLCSIELQSTLFDVVAPAVAQPIRQLQLVG